MRRYDTNLKTTEDIQAMTINNIWWVYALLSAFFAALTTILAKVGVQEINSNLATAIRTIVILVIAWGIVLARREATGITAIPTRTIVFLVLSGVVTGLSWLAYFRALQLGPTGLVAAIDKSSLVMIVLLSALFLHEALTWRIAIGVTLIVIGTIIATT